MKLYNGIITQLPVGITSRPVFIDSPKRDAPEFSEPKKWVLINTV